MSRLTNRYVHRSSGTFMWRSAKVDVGLRRSRPYRNENARA